MDVKMAAALQGGVGNVTQFCRRQGITRATFYKWQARVRAEGPDGLQERSRRPHTSPGITAAEVEDQIVRIRKELADNGDYNGPESIRERLVVATRRDAVMRGWTPRRVQQAVDEVPSRATIARVLTRRGQVKPAPGKRPRSSYHRFEAARPNEMWQSDWTSWHLTSGRLVAIAGTVDDHSRLLVGIGACHGYGTAELVWQVMSTAIEAHGIPMTSLSDNGRVYSLRRYRDAGETAFEINLQALGCRVATSTPYHPQTCGKIERLWQTLKKWLTAHGPYATVGELNTALVEFTEYYNHQRPHRALHGRTPAEVFAATGAARPADRPLPATLSVRRCWTSNAGVVPVGLHHVVALGARWKRIPVTVIRDGDHVAIYAGNRLIRTLDIDPTRTYQPLGARPPKTR
jgi:transposase InsO family protein